MAQVKIFPDGSVEVSLGTQEIGGGQATVAAVAASQALGDLPYERIKVLWGDSGYPPSATCAGSQATRAIVTRVQPAADGVLKKLLALVAKEWGVPRNQIKLESGGTFVGPGEGGKRVKWEEATAKIEGVLVSYADPSGAERLDRGLAVENEPRHGRAMEGLQGSSA